MTRQLLLVGACLLGLGALLTGMALHSSEPAASAAKSSPVFPEINPALQEIVRCGAMAPSSHNAQMWRIKINSPQQLTVCLDQSQCLPEVDPVNREAFISLGAMIENMSQAATQLGFQTEVRILAQQPSATEAAQLTFTPGSGTSPSLKNITTIANRHTIRTPYLGKDLQESDLQQLQSLSGSLHYFPLHSPAGSTLKTAILESMEQQTANDSKQKEFSQWVRFSKQSAAQSQNGITPAMMGLSGLAKAFVGWFYRPQTVMTPSFRKQTAAATKRQVQNCAGFFIITSPDSSIPSLINTGRVLERFWLQATTLQIAVHPMSSAVEEKPWQDELHTQLAIKQPIQLVLRVGYVRNYGQPVSPRKDLKRILCE